MKKTWLWIAIFVIQFRMIPAQGVDQLAQSTSGYLSSFFRDKFDARAAIVQIENFTDLSDLAIQKAYQLVFAHLETEKNLQFFDLLIDFTGNKGNFNLNKADQLNYWIYLKFVQNRNKIGLGVVVFSKRTDKMVGFKYTEQEIPRGEKDVLNTRLYGFSELGFARKIELDARAGLLDVQVTQGPDGQPEYFFFYPEEIVIYRVREQHLDKQSSINLQWPRPLYPSQEPEGKLSLFSDGQIRCVTVGSNFAPEAKLFRFENGTWRESDHIPFTPLKRLEINRQSYLVGGQYEMGKNFFRDNIFFLPLRDGALDKKSIYGKQVPAFYSVDFSIAEQQLQAIHLIGADYQYHLFSRDFIENPVQMPRRGSALAIQANEWMAVSDYSRVSDRLFFFDIRDGGEKLVYENKIDGEIIFMTAGVWQGQSGFWVYVRSMKNGYAAFLLQFWSKGNG